MLSYILPPLAGAFIGYVTNDIAIRMLFRPHEPKYLFGAIRIPFTPGIIPKERGRIAEEIAIAISENLMDKATLEKYLLSDEMTGKVRAAVQGFIDQQKTNNETLREFLSRFLSEKDIETATATSKNFIAKEATPNFATRAWARWLPIWPWDTYLRSVAMAIMASSPESVAVGGAYPWQATEAAFDSVFADGAVAERFFQLAHFVVDKPRVDYRCEPLFVATRVRCLYFVCHPNAPLLIRPEKESPPSAI